MQRTSTNNKQQTTNNMQEMSRDALSPYLGSQEKALSMAAHDAAVATKTPLLSPIQLEGKLATWTWDAGADLDLWLFSWFCIPILILEVILTYIDSTYDTDDVYRLCVFLLLCEALRYFPECVARVPVSGGLGVRLCSLTDAFVSATVRNRPQPSATVCVRSVRLSTVASAAGRGLES